MVTVIAKYGHSLRTTTTRALKKEGLFRGSIA